jgi:hypothetical protein
MVFSLDLRFWRILWASPHLEDLDGRSFGWDVRAFSQFVELTIGVAARNFLFVAGFLAIYL